MACLPGCLQHAKSTGQFGACKLGNVVAPFAPVDRLEASTASPCRFHEWLSPVLRAAYAVCNVLKRRQLSGARNFLYPGAENRESAAPGPRFPQIPPQGPLPGRRALRRTAAPGKKTWRGRHGQHCQQQTRNTARFPQNILFLGSCPTSGAWRWFSKRCRTRRCRRGSRSGAGATRFVQRATIAVLQHERSLVRELNRNPARVARLQPAGLPGQAEGRR